MYQFLVDGGGTKTDVELRAADGRVLARHRGAACNLYQDPQAGLEAIWQGWRVCAENAGVALEQTGMTAGLAGVTAAGAPSLFYQAFAGFAARSLSSDGYLAVVAAFGDQPGGLVSIGTGVVGSRFDRAGRYTQLGGWGFPVGDCGGGAWLGLQLVSAWLEHRDGMGEGAGSPALWQAVAERVGDQRSAVLAWLRAARPGDFATLAPAVLQATQLGDDVAVRLYRAALAHIARLATALAGDDRLPLALAGGLAAPFRGDLSAMDLPWQPDAVISPLEGAWRIACGVRPAEYPIA